jgi:hypothetical protein
MTGKIFRVFCTHLAPRDDQCEKRSMTGKINGVISRSEMSTYKPGGSGR